MRARRYQRVGRWPLNPNKYLKLGSQEIPLFPKRKVSYPVFYGRSHPRKLRHSFERHRQGRVVLVRVGVRSCPVYSGGRIFQVLSVLEPMSIGAVALVLSRNGVMEGIKTKEFPWFRKSHLTELRISTLQAFRRSIKMTLQRCGSMLFSECT